MLFLSFFYFATIRLRAKVSKRTIRVRDRIHVGDLLVERRSEGAQLAVGRRTAEAIGGAGAGKKARDERKNNYEIEKKQKSKQKPEKALPVSKLNETICLVLTRVSQFEDTKVSANMHTHTLTRTHAHT